MGTRQRGREQDGRTLASVTREADETLSTVAVLRIVKVFLDIETVPGSVGTHLDRLLDSEGGFSALVRLLDRIPRLNRAAADLWRRVSRPDILRRVVGLATDDGLHDSGADGHGIGLGRPSVTSEFGLVGEIEDIIDEHEDQLQDEPLRHREPLVRKAAVRRAASRPSMRFDALQRGLEDSDPGVRAAALQSPRVGECPGITESVARIALDRSESRGLREAAVNVLGEMDDPSALSTLLDLAVDRGGLVDRLLGRWAIRHRSPLLHAALRSLFFGGWSDENEVRRVVEIALDSPDARVRSLAEASAGRDAA